MTFVCLTIQSLPYTATPGVPVVRVAVWVFQIFLHTLVSVYLCVGVRARVSAFVWAKVSVCKVHDGAAESAMLPLGFGAAAFSFFAC